MNLEDLSPEERKKIMDEARQELERQEEVKQENKKTFKKLKEEYVKEHLPLLIDHHNYQSSLIDKVISNSKDLIHLKEMAYEVDENQDSHTWTASDGSGSFKVGWNVLISFDGTEGPGITKIKEYIKSLGGSNKNKAIIQSLVNTLLKSDKEGKLDPNRIIELQQIANEVRNQKLSEGVSIIVDAQMRTRSSMYISGWYMKNEEDGKSTKEKFHFRV